MTIPGLGTVERAGRRPGHGRGVARRPPGEDPAGHGCCRRGAAAWSGKVAELAYFGGISHVYITLDGGQRVAVFRSNASRAELPGLEQGATCWLDFAPEDAVLLRS